MNIRDHSSQFSIFVYSTDVDQGASVKVSLSQAGYDAYYIQEMEVFQQRLKEMTPHLVVFSTTSVQGILSDFVNKVLEVSPEIKLIAMAEPQQFEALSQYNTLGLVDIVSLEGPSLDMRAVWAVDQTCETLYLTYQNEQLFTDWKEAQGQKDKLQQQVNDQKAVQQETSQMLVSNRVADYRSSQSKEEVLQKYFERLEKVPAVYFKYLTSVRSFVATHASGFSSQQIQGVGCQLEGTDLESLNTQITVGLLPPIMMEMLQKVFQIQTSRVLPLFVQNQLEGVVIYSGDLGKADTLRVGEEFSLFALCYSYFCLEKKVESLDVMDFVTDLYNQKFYVDKLHEELERSRRLQQPVSVLKISIDDFFEIEQTLGSNVRDEVLKTIGDYVRRTIRTNDFACRTQVNEFGVILPHCHKKGAALLGERLRRIVESSAILDSGVKISISVGVSEYPSLADSVGSLDETATKALMHIMEKGGNRICLFKPSGNFTPEFEVVVD
ncbi:GGDEF domain-containing protein [Bdellovibrio sp. HCB337]|uniref:GGDEF domain-containing protein n=1 Tax=Bdellovibrio sp. HCB337 TaxID=3394358 RepID=UPI0039A71572